MMGRLKSEQVQLFYEFNLEDAVPDDHLVRRIDAALDLSWLRSELAAHYSSMGRPSIDPELMIRMLVVGYVFAIRSERLICREVQEKGIAPHIPVFDKSKRDDGTFSRSDFRYDPTSDVYHCPGGKRLGTGGTVHEGKTLLYRASKLDCDVCPLKPQCCPKEPSRKIPRDIHENARDVARSLTGTEGFETSRRERKKIEMRFAHLKRILKLGRLRLRGPRGAQDEFVLAAIAQNLRRLASLVARPPPTQALCIA
jgi:hypothetical protein